VLAGAVDDTLNERLATRCLFGAEADAEQPFDEDLVGRCLGATTARSFGDLEGAPTDDADRNRVDHPVDDADRDRHRRVEFGFERHLL